MQVKIKRLSPNAIVPKYAKDGDAGLDLTAISQEFEQTSAGRKLQVYGTGLAVEIPKGFVGLIFPRSSIAKTALSLTNCVGVIDSGFRGEIKFKFALEDNFRASGETSYKVGERIGQLIIMPYPDVEFEEVSELSSTERGEGGFGSSGV